MWLVLATSTGQIWQRTPQIIFFCYRHTSVMYMYLHVSVPYKNAVGKVITIVFMSIFFLFLLLFDIDLWPGDSKIFTDSFHLVCLPLLSNSWVNKTGSGRRKWDFISFLLIEITGEFGTRSALPGAKSSKQMGTSPTAFVCATEGSVLPKVVKLAGT